MLTGKEEGMAGKRDENHWCGENTELQAHLLLGKVFCKDPLAPNTRVIFTLRWYSYIALLSPPKMLM